MAVSPACSLSPQKSTPQPPPDSTASFVAEEITADLENDPDLLAEILDFSLPSTDDGADEDFRPDAPKDMPDLCVIEKPAAPIQPKQDSPIKTTNEEKKKPAPKKQTQPAAPIRVYRDASASATPSPQRKIPKNNRVPSTWQHGGRGPPQTKNIKKEKAANFLPDPRSQPPLIPRVQGPRHTYNPRNFPPSVNNRWPRHRPPPPRRISHNRPSLRHPLAPISHNVPLQSRNQPPANHLGSSFQNFYISPPNPQMPQQYNAHHYGQPPVNPPTSTPLHYHQNHPQPPQPANSQPQPQHHQLPPPPPIYNHQTTVPTTGSSSSYDESTGVIRPSHDSILKMHHLGLKVVYAVSWTNGGGVFLSKSEAEISKATAQAAGSSPLPIHTLRDMACNLFQNEALALNWVLENMKTPVNSASPTATTPQPANEKPGIHTSSKQAQDTPAQPPISPSPDDIKNQLPYQHTSSPQNHPEQMNVHTHNLTHNISSPNSTIPT